MNKINLPHAAATKTTLGFAAWYAAAMIGNPMPRHIAIANGTESSLWTMWDEGKTVWDAHYDLGHRSVVAHANRNA